MPALREVEQEHGSLLRVVIHHLAQNHERPDSADTVEKLEKNEGIFFCRKPKHSKLTSALTM